MVTTARGMRVVETDHVGELNQQFRKCGEMSMHALAEWIRLGQLLNEKKEDKNIPHGEWQRWFDDGELLFGLRWAQKLMAASRNAALTSKTNHDSFLPCDINTLEKLAKIPATKLTKLIDSGQVNTTTTRAEAAKLVREVKGKGERSAPEELTGQRAVDAVIAKARKAIDDLLLDRPRLRGRLVTALRELAEGLSR